MKITSSDLLAILRRFGEAGDDHVPRLIDQISQAHPNPTNQAVRFRFNRSYYFVLVDDAAEDNVDYIIDQLRLFKNETTGSLMVNPTSQITTYGLPFKGKDIYLFKENNGKKRLDVLLAEKFPNINRSTWQKYISVGYVRVNGQIVTKSSSEFREADSFAVDIPAGTDFSDRSLPIIYLDDNVIVVNKPAGILTHSKGALNDEFTVADFFRRYTNVGLETNRPGIVHRLDRDTSGLIIGARTPEAFDILKSQFADRKAKKTYLAITSHSLKQPKAVIDIPIARNPNSPSTFQADSKGKSAQTSYQVIEANDKFSLLLLQPRTGRTHQLRVHLAHIGAPILGDRVYGKPDSRLFLHAYKLEITTAPEQRQVFVANIPDEFITKIPDAKNVVA